MNAIRQFLQDVRDDLIRYNTDGKISFPRFVYKYLTNSGFACLYVYRFSKLLYDLGVRVIPQMILRRFHIEISLRAHIEGGFLLAHPVGTVIVAETVIKRGAAVMQGVTIGTLLAPGTWAKRKGAPVLEEDCVIFAGAQVFGPITIGKRARVAANALVMMNVPEGMTAIGNPARIVETLPADMIPERGTESRP
jgi:serine O-acetyltransferase